MMECRSSLTVWALACVAITVVALAGRLQAQEKTDEPIRRTLAFRGAEREYFVRLPHDFDRSKLYWLLVVVHGGGGNGRTYFIASGVSRAAAELGLDAIVVAPTFRNDDDNLSRFPVLGEGAFLERVLAELRRDYRVRPKILLTGYSRGGQFSHRFALANPEQVEAVAPFASGTWTTPDGRLLIESLGEVRNPESFLTIAQNASAVPERLRDLFESRVAGVAGFRARPGAEDIPFLVMCGTLDPRLGIAREFVRSLEALGYAVATQWPRTPHTCSDDAAPDDRAGREPGAECRREFEAEFQKYSRGAVEFFLRVSLTEVTRRPARR